MKKSRFWMIAAILTFCGTMTIQAQVKYCMTFAEFVADQWQQADNASVEPISAAKRRLVQSSDFHIVSSDKELSDMLNKKAYAVMDGQTLYVNCRHYRYQGVQFGPGYAYGFRYDGDKICIVNRKIGKGELMAVGAIGTVTPGVVTSAVVGAAEQEILMANKVCYLVDSEPNKKGITKIQYINEKFINDVLGDNEELKSQYNAAGGKQSRQSAANTLQTLRAAGLIKQ